MTVQDTSLAGVKLILGEKPSIDHRGAYREIYTDKDYFPPLGIKFVQDDISYSTKDVLRGIHGDVGTWKLVSCILGSFSLVVVNCELNHSQYMKWERFNLTETEPTQVLIPPNFGNGHLITSPEAIFHYKQSTYYGEYKQFTVKWDDTELSIPWDVDTPILSKRDELGPFLQW